MKYPIFLRFTATSALYKITNDHSFEEVKTLGDYYFVNEVSDDILPMRNYIMDLIEAEGVEKISEEEFTKAMDELKLTKTKKEF